MIGIILLTHGQMAEACLSAAEMIVGPIAASCAISIDRTRPVEEATQDLGTALGELGAAGNGVLILTDLFGGTPTNIAAEYLEPDRVEILSGVNLPLVIKAASARHQLEIDALTELLQEYGRQAILRPATLLKARS